MSTNRDNSDEDADTERSEQDAHEGVERIHQLQKEMARLRDRVEHFQTAYPNKNPQKPDL